MPAQRQVSPGFLFETIGRLTIENDLIKKENEALMVQVNQNSKKDNSPDIPSQTP